LSFAKGCQSQTFLVLFVLFFLFRPKHTVIDTDDTQSQASGVGMDPNIVASMMMSPTLLNKRLLQAIRAVEANHWQQVSYLISANPW